MDEITRQLYTKKEVEEMTACHENYTAKITGSLTEKPFYTTKKMNEAERFRQSRLYGIGGSDLSLLFFNDSFNKKTTYDLWQSKRDWLGDPTLNEIGSPADIGHRREPEIAQLYKEITGNAPLPARCSLRHQALPWISANIDFDVDEQRGLECKTTRYSAAKRSRWGPGNEYLLDEKDDDFQKILSLNDEVPARALFQCNHYMFVMNRPEWDLAAMIDASDFRIYTITRSDELISKIVKRATEFWFNNVIGNKPPDPITNRDLESIYKRDTGETKLATPESIRAHKKLLELRVQIEKLNVEAYGEKNGSKRTGGLDLILKKDLGENSTLVNSSGEIMCTYRWQGQSRLDGSKLKIKHPKIHAEFYAEGRSRKFLPKIIEY